MCSCGDACTTTPGCLRFQVIHDSLTCAWDGVIFNAQRVCECTVGQFCFGVRVTLGLCVVLKFDVLIVQLRKPHLVIKILEFDRSLCCLCSLFSTRTLTQTSDERRTALIWNTGKSRTTNVSNRLNNRLKTACRFRRLCSLCNAACCGLLQGSRVRLRYGCCWRSILRWVSRARCDI